MSTDSGGTHRILNLDTFTSHLVAIEAATGRQGDPTGEAWGVGDIPCFLEWIFARTIAGQVRVTSRVEFHLPVAIAMIYSRHQIERVQHYPGKRNTYLVWLSSSTFKYNRHLYSR